MGRIRRSLRRGLVAAGVALLALTLVATGVSAHERRNVANTQFVVGFLNEPALLEEPNGLSLRVQTADGKPVEGLANTLKAEVKFGGESMPLTLGAAFGNPGSYQAHFIPTAAGTYIFHIYGDVNGAPVDETFTSGPNTFSNVESRAAVSFPQKVEPVGAVQEMADSALDRAGSARLLGIAGLVVGALGLIAGGAGLALGLSRRSEPVARPRATRADLGDGAGRA